MSRAPRQNFLPGFDGLKVRKFGGTELKGNAREARPISIQRPLHLVMKSSLAKGDRSFLRAKRARQIETLARRLGRDQRVKVLRFANSGNHLHLLVLPSTKKAFHAYVRALSGLIARLTLGAERGHAKGIRFWDAKPFTRIVEWGRDFRGVCRYLLLNTLEAIGFPDPRPAPSPDRNSRPAGATQNPRALAPLREPMLLSIQCPRSSPPPSNLSSKRSRSTAEPRS